MKAWHFHNGSTLRDGRPLPKVGETLVHDGEPILCKQGLHASVYPLDALRNGPGTGVDRVEVGGTIVRGDDKLVATERTTLWRVDATDVLRRFARLCALDVVHLWDAPDVVARYLRTGDDSLRKRVEMIVLWAVRTSREEARAAAQAAECVLAEKSTAVLGGVAWAAQVTALATAAQAARAEDKRNRRQTSKQNLRLYRMLLAAGLQQYRMPPGGNDE